MDELQLVKQLRHSTPAITPAAEEAASTRLAAALTDPTPSESPILRPRRRAPVLASRRRVGFGLGLVAAGVVAAVTITAVGHNAAPPQRAGAGLAADGSPRLTTQKMMLAAAKADLQPLGRYWWSNVVEGQSYLVSAKTGKYMITGAASETFEWTSAKPGGGNLFYGRDLPARPQTPSDVAAWRRAGSPGSFRVWSNDHYQTYTRAAGRWSADKAQARPGGRFIFTGFGGSTPATSGATVKDLQALSTDPRQLRKRFQLPQLTSDQILADIGLDLMKAPVPPKLRAGIMRMIPTLPGVYPIGTVTDPLGRKGIGYAADSPDHGDFYQGYGAREELIFSDNGDFLAERYVLTKPGSFYAKMSPGDMLNYRALRGSGWTGTKPSSPPQKLPF
jgi:hypothetical protein